MFMSVQKDIEKVVKNNFVFTEIILRDIVNYRKLAKLLQKDYGIDASIETIAIALQRLKRKLNTKIKFKEQELYEVNIRNNIVILSVKKNNETKKRITRMQSEDYFFSYMESKKYYEIICNKLSYENVKKVFNEHLLYLEQDLSLITIRFSERILKTPGILATILRDLAFNNINVFLIYTTHKEINIVIKEKDSTLAYALITQIR